MCLTVDLLVDCHHDEEELDEVVRGYHIHQVFGSTRSAPSRTFDSLFAVLVWWDVFLGLLLQILYRRSLILTASA